uniref:K Homology domain-containing protein n=1 Tax=Haptolina brevifila TaxID=156173 RepID=A0A7S2J756_9EUKA
MAWLEANPWELRKCKSQRSAENVIAQLMGSTAMASPSVGSTAIATLSSSTSSVQRHLKPCPAARALLLQNGAAGLRAAKAEAARVLSSAGLRGEVNLATHGMYEWTVSVTLQVEHCPRAVTIANRAADAAIAMLEPVVVRIALPRQIHVRHMVGRGGAKVKAFQQRIAPMVNTACGGAVTHMQSQVRLSGAEVCVAVLLHAEGEKHAEAFRTASASARRVLTHRVQMWLEAKRQSLLGSLEEFETRAARPRGCILPCKRDMLRKAPCSWIELHCDWPKERQRAKRARNAQRDGRQCDTTCRALRDTRQRARNSQRDGQRRYLLSHTIRGSRSDVARRLVRWSEP